jgi:hypothetical protein
MDEQVKRTFPFHRMWRVHGPLARDIDDVVCFVTHRYNIQMGYERL